MIPLPFFLFFDLLMIVVKFYFLYVLDTVTILASRLVGVLFKVAGYQRQCG